jgi:hypothetical protein
MEDEELQFYTCWFTQLDSHHRKLFVESLVPRILPNKLTSQFSAINLSSALQPMEKWSDCKDFDEQLMFFHKCCTGWSVDKANRFLALLESVDALLMYSLCDMIAQTAGDP